jgi:hypothetical protein
MTDWGIPNWLDQHAYGDTKRWSEYRWRWEFIRRREDCRQDFLTHKDGTVRFYEELYAKMQHPGFPGRILRPDEPGFVARVPGCYERYGLANLPNPAIGDQPFYIIMFRKRGPSLLMHTEEGINECFKTTEAVVIFDLTAPIGDQVEGAREMLKCQQQLKLGYIVHPGKKHPTKWLTYLRTLDARENRASLTQIATGVLGWTKEHTRTDPAQWARDTVKQAEALCFNWPD